MKLFVAKLTPGMDLRSVEVFSESDHHGAAVAKEQAEADGLEAAIFFGADLLDVVRSYPAWFGEGE